MKKHKEIKLRKVLTGTLKQKYQDGKGHSKHDAKLQHRDYDCIYSKVTLENYLKHVNAFVDVCYQHDIRDKENARLFVAEYLQHEIDRGLAASTVHLKASALAKAFGCSYEDFGVKLPKRERKDYTRSRYAAVRDRDFSVENNADIIAFCSATGLRRHELAKFRGTDLIEQNGRLYVHVIQGKGGKERYTEVYAPEDVKCRIKELCQRAQDNLVFPVVPSHMDVHSYRSIYCSRVYAAHARPLDQLPRKDKYYCRKERKGEVFDKKAMKIVSRNLGHNRIDVIAQSYLR